MILSASQIIDSQHLPPDLTSYTAHIFSLESIPTKDIETEYAFKHWNYCIRLARFMLDEALLDKSEFLDKFLLEKLESLRPSDDGLLRFLIPLVSKLERVIII